MAFVYWPYDVLTPSNPSFQPRPFSRGGGRSLGGIQRTVRTDRGYWVGRYGSIYLRRGRADQRRIWNAIRVSLLGTAGLLVAPICATNLLGTGAGGGSGGGGSGLGIFTVPHSDETPHSDGAPYSQSGGLVVLDSAAALGASIITLKVLGGNLPTVAGTRFSYNHALYEIGQILATPAAGTYRVTIFPTIRQAIPAGAPLEFARPDCLVHLATDSEMDIEYPLTGVWTGDVNFVEAVDYWNDLALGLTVETLPGEAVG